MEAHPMVEIALVFDLSSPNKRSMMNSAISLVGYILG